VNQAARPYQSAITGQIDYARSLNFKGSRFYRIPRAKPLQYYFDSNADFYRDGVAEFAYRADQATCGRVIRRLEMLYDEVYIDEMQDLAGYDLEFLDLLFSSKMHVTVVGDPRQHTYTTNRSAKNKQYRGHAMVDWLNKHGPGKFEVCPIWLSHSSYRSSTRL
jgi:hypothetical protein